MPTTTRHARDWTLWASWCTATGNNPQQPTAATLTAFTRDCPASPTITAQRVRAIRSTLTDAPATTPRDERVPAELIAAIGSIPVLGWPDSVRGRRDAYLLALHALGIPRNTARRTMPRHITLDPLRVRGISIPAAPDPGDCIACALTRWLRMAMVIYCRGSAAARNVMASLPLTSAANTTRHDCTMPLPHQWRTVPTLAPRIDKHAHVEFAAPLSRRAAAWITRRRIDHAQWIAADSSQSATAGQIEEPLPLTRPAPNLRELDAVLRQLTADVDALYQAARDLANTVQAHAHDVYTMRRDATQPRP